MGIDFLHARQRMYDDYKTLSGVDGGECVGGYFEMYREAFFERLDANGCLTPPELALILEKANECESVGDFLSAPKEQLIELAAFGLVLLDRIALTGWGRFDPDRCFFLHEQMFECFEYVRDASKQTANARSAAEAKYRVNAEVREFVTLEWKTHSSAYGFNKSEFARTYVGLVRNKFSDSKGDPYVVTEKTIREIWLKDTPTASSRAG